MNPFVDEPEDFQTLTGYRIVEWRERFAAVEMEVLKRHRNRSGLLHGGMITTLLDVACARSATYSSDPDRPRYIATLSLSVNFLKAIGDGLVRAVGHTANEGQRILTCRGELLDDKQRLVAVCQGIYRYRDRSHHSFDHAPQSPS